MSLVDATNDTIPALLVRYIDALGAGDDDLLRHGVWAPDGVWEVTSLGRFVAIDAIVGALVEMRTQIVQVLQVITGASAVIDDSAMTGRGRCYIHELTLRTDGSERELRGVYDDRFVMTCAGWRFSHRTFTPVYRVTRETSGGLAHPGAAQVPERRDAFPTEGTVPHGYQISSEEASRTDV